MGASYAVTIPYQRRHLHREPAPSTGYESREATLEALPNLLRQRSIRPAPEPFVCDVSDNGIAFYIYRSQADSDADPTGARPLAVVTISDNDTAE